jgi:actin-related protein 5
MLPPPTVYPVQEVKFERHMPPQVDGREKALARPPGTTAIVIDNGKARPISSTDCH